jgi:hypothetical protein
VHSIITENIQRESWKVKARGIDAVGNVVVRNKHTSPFATNFVLNNTNNVLNNTK